MFYKIFIVLSFFSFTLNFSQNSVLTVNDKETNEPISYARILLENEILYTNEDGKVLIPNNSKIISISAPSYEEVNTNLSTNPISLKPIYKNIEEVNLTKIDVNKLFESILDTYDKVYYNKPSIYSGTYNDKLYINNSLNNILISDVNFWALNNQYNFRKSNLDNFVQISLNGIKYYKTSNSNQGVNINISNFRNEKAVKAFTQRLFLHGQLYLMVYALKAKITGKVISENEDTKIISFDSEPDSKTGVICKGTFTYQKKDNAISYLQVEQIQPNATKKIKDGEGDKLNINNKSVIITYDLYKKQGSYYPSRYTALQVGSVDYHDKNYSFSRLREIIFEKFRTSNENGLTNKLDLSKDITSSIPDKTIKDSKDLLSKQEQEFIDGK